MANAAPIKVTAEQLGLNIGEEYEGQLEYDLGNLSAHDPAPVDQAQFSGSLREDAIAELARGMTQSLSNKLFALPAEPTRQGRLALLPPPSTVLPRFQPMPKPKALTKWQKFAQQKGITKRKRSKLVFDEQSQEWKRRHGYGRANDELGHAIIEASDKDKDGEDPFTRLERERKERVKKNKKQQLDNVKDALKVGAKLPTTLKLSSNLPTSGRTGGPKERGKRKGMKDEIKAAHLQAGVSTASMGKFDRRLKGEKDGERSPAGKRRKFMSATDTSAERSKLNSYADKFLRERSDDVLDIRKAIGKLEAGVREERHAAKAAGGGGGGGGGKAGRGGGKAGRGGRGASGPAKGKTSRGGGAGGRGKGGGGRGGKGRGRGK